jgi:uncharacterized protein DUF4331
LKKLALLGGAGGLGLVALLAWHHSTQAADHADSPSITNFLADINDVYAWTTSDATKLNLAISTSPFDDGRAFDPAVQYVFHLSSKAGLGVGNPDGIETRVICTFASNTSIQCWVVDGATVKDFVTGDPSNTAGLASADGKLKVFAGRRSDPFFFNLGGFNTAIKAAHDLAAAGQIQFDAMGCPNKCGAGGADVGCVATAGQVRTILKSPPANAPPCPATDTDCFKTLNVLMLVVQLDKGLVNTGANTTVGVWASTHAAP